MFYSFFSTCEVNALSIKNNKNLKSISATPLLGLIVRSCIMIVRLQEMQELNLQKAHLCTN